MILLKKLRKIHLFPLLLLLSSEAISNSNTIYKNGIIPITNYEVLQDTSGRLGIQQITQLPFKIKEHSGFTDHGMIWFKFNIQNNSNFDTLLLEIKNPVLEDVTFYTVVNNNIISELSSGIKHPFSKRTYKVTGLLYPVKVTAGQTATIYVRIKSVSSIDAPLYLGNTREIFGRTFNDFLLIGIYCGIIFIMFFYNMFVYFSVKDKSYLYYIIYIFAVGVTQFILNGYAYMYLWPNNPWLAVNSINLCGIFSGVMTLAFTRNFLNTQKIVPTLHKILGLLILTDLLTIFITLFIDRLLALNIINMVALTGSCFTIYCAFIVSKKNFRPARFFLGAFSVFLVAVIIYVMRTKGYIEYNSITERILEIGSTLQIMLLSFALADKINTYRKEQNLARREALRISKENERLVRDQNIILEKQVHERTQELEAANHTLSNTLTQLKETQSKLVESEKMVSLGQLTAGIAHEINNPINFVVSNVKPLELDINDLLSIIQQYEKIDTSRNVDEQIQEIDLFKKQIDINYINEEIGILLSGIKDGANRTAEIVSNLKNFARVDEANAKQVDINEGIESTLMLVKNIFPKDFILKKEYGDLPKVECIPGKINQVFMNIITNAIQAIEERQAESAGTGELIIKTYIQDTDVKISITDNGKGMDKTVQEKIFEPFFTTKPVGQGTGLGMSIVKGIIDSHSGLVDVKSILGIGTEFIITLPLKFTAPLS
ncbi:MAG: 7TM diverse intracellular signaling domain-containing protein [Niabella sp.]